MASVGRFERSASWKNDSVTDRFNRETGAVPLWKRTNSEGNELPLKFGRNDTYQKPNFHDEADMEEVLDFFEKKFSYDNPGWNLPSVDIMYKEEKWQIDNFISMKDDLNNVKNKLNHFNLDEWHKHTRAMNKAGNVLWRLKKDFDVEFATQAWCKFHEICGSFSFVGDEALLSNQLNSVHLCEAPGAFITSLNHYLQLHHPDIKWSWISTTLNPYYEANPLSNMINDDRFILHTLDRWKFGYNYTGNLMDVKNLKYMVDEARAMGPILMVTADGSIDCQNNPGEQESIVSQLNFCEVVCALHLLSPGGSFVVKMFTMYEEQTISLMYMLVCSFKFVHVYKPATSKEGNSEVYVVCLDYHGTEELKPWLRLLRTQYNSKGSDKAMIPLSALPDSFLRQHHKCAEKFKNYQIEVIERNILLFKSENKEQSLKRTRRLKYLVGEEYIKRYGVKSLAGIGKPIVDPLVLKKTETPNIDPRCEEGSFSDRLEREKLTPLEKLEMIQKDIEKCRISWDFENVKWLTFTSATAFQFQTGKSVKSVNSSKFCLGKLLKLRNDVRQIAKEHFKHEDESLVPEAKNELSSELRSMVEAEYPAARNDAVILNYKESLWACLDSENVSSERDVFSDIIDEVDHMWRGSSLVVEGYPMLTQFTVGLIFLLGHLFERVGFVRPHGQNFAVIFDSYGSRNVAMDKHLDHLANLMDQQEEDTSVLTVTPLKQLIDGHPEFYSCVTAVNNLCVKEQICDIINKIVQSDLPNRENRK